MSGRLEVDIRHRLGALALEAAFTSDGPVTVLFGRSGSGKTSLANVIAGLIRPEAGRVVCGDAVLSDAGRRLFVPVHQRRIGYVFQDARLFPHLTVRRNLLYGRWFAGRDAAGPPFEEIVDLLGLGALLDRRPDRLSGGEKQRVAIGRALLARPRLLVMDEPLASLDEARKDEIIVYIAQIATSAKVPIVYVTHSVREVIRLASHVALMDNGRLQAFGPLATMLGRIGPAGETGPAEPGVLLEAVVREVDPAFGLAHLDTGMGGIEIARAGLRPGQRVRIRILASDVMLALRAPEAISARNLIAAQVIDLAPVPDGTGARVDAHLRAGQTTFAARITTKACHELGLVTGARVVAVIKSVAIES